MKKLVLSVGFHKTATSSIQSTLAKNRSVLDEFGYLFPIFDLNGRLIQNHSIPVMTLFGGNPERYGATIKWGISADEAKRTYGGQIDEALSTDKNLIICGEDISLLSVNALRELKSYIESFGYVIEVFACVRAPYSYCCSLIQQKVKGGEPALSTLPIHDLPKRVNNLFSAFGDVKFFPFYDLLEHPAGPVGFFLENALNLQSDSFELHSSNESVSNETVRLLNFVNLRYPCIIDNSVNPKRRDFMDLTWRLKIGASKFLLSSEEYAHISNEIDRQNLLLSQIFGDGYSDNRIDFSDKMVFFDNDVVDLIDRSLTLPAHLRACVYDFLCFNEYPERDLLLPLFN